ncbi:MAG: heme NO-binding protein, partial [Mangrovicoccus sp.]
HFPGFAHVLVGLLRTLADDYGTLAYLEFSGSSAGREDITIHLLDSGFASGRSFDLAAGA